MQGTPKDTIPVKSPRRQRSSRFFVRNVVELEQYPNFQGKSLTSSLGMTTDLRNL